jgi:hypothetical protein
MRGEGSQIDRSEASSNSDDSSGGAKAEPVAPAAETLGYDPVYGLPERRQDPIRNDGRMHFSLIGMWDPVTYVPGAKFVTQRLTSDDPHREVVLPKEAPVDALLEILSLAPLRGLKLEYATVTESDWKTIESLDVEVLIFYECDIRSILTVESLDLPRLKYFAAYVSDDLAIRCCKVLGNTIEVLDLSPSAKQHLELTDKMNEAFQYCPRLREVCIWGSRSSKELLWSLAEIKTLEYVNLIPRDDFSIEAKRRFKQLRPDVKAIWARGA